MEIPTDFILYPSALVIPLQVTASQASPANSHQEETAATLSQVHKKSPTPSPLLKLPFLRKTSSMGHPFCALPLSLCLLRCWGTGSSGEGRAGGTKQWILIPSGNQVTGRKESSGMPPVKGKLKPTRKVFSQKTKQLQIPVLAICPCT